MLAMKGQEKMPAEKRKSESEIKNRPEEAENDLGATSRRFAGSATRAVVSLALIPFNMLPVESRQHMKNAAREATLGVAALVRELADSMERMAEESQK